jgi:signal transduction histidine kinase
VDGRIKSGHDVFLAGYFMTLGDRASLTPRAAPASRVRGRLFRKYVALFVAVVSIALLANGLFEIWFSYREHQEALVRIQREQAEAAAAKIGQFVKEIESQLGWTTQLPWSSATLEQRRVDALRLLKQVPAITELTQLDGSGAEKLRVSRLAMDVVGSGADLSHDPKFAEAVAHKVYYGPVYFRRESEPYMTLSLAGTSRVAGVSVAEVNLKFIWDVVSQIKVGERGEAFVVDADGRLIAHPDISLVLRNTDLSGLAQVQAARTGGAPEETLARNVQGHRVLSAHAAIAPLGWMVFVELPRDEAYAPLYASIERSSLLLLGGLGLAFLAGLFLARRMVVPIEALRAGAARIGGGDLGQRIAIATGDELEALANQFNDMAAQLQESYADLEKKVELRTRELSEALEQQTATAEVLRVISGSPGDLEPVFDAILSNATRICEAQFAVLRRIDRDSFETVATRGVPPAFADYLRNGGKQIQSQSQLSLGRAIQSKKPFQVTDVRVNNPYLGRDPQAVALVELGGARTVLAVPMLKDNEAIGAITIYRQEVREFTEKQIAMVASFADQAVIAIENVRLLNELRERTRELARSVEELRALGEVSQAVNSTLKVETVLQTIVAKAVQLSRTHAGAIYVFDEKRREFELRATYGMDETLIAAIRGQHFGIGENSIGQAVRAGTPVQVSDLREDPAIPIQNLIVRAGYRALLVIPLLSPEGVVGALVVRRREPGDFAKASIDLLQTFAAQSVLAIQNARLFREIEEKGRQLEVASRHKSQFLANMSHELRTPLNAVLGYSEMMLDGLYGELPEKAKGVLERVQRNGRHLLGLINDVLDLSKIEAGQLTLALDDYSMSALVKQVVSTTESLARAKGLALTAAIQDGLPAGRGDERRLTQVLLNLVGNAIKFTDKGAVELAAEAKDGRFTVAVSDSGPGIAEADQARIFEEFQQVDNTNTRKKGGTGLGLAIAKRIIEMHGGTLTVESAVGTGSTFRVILPVRAEQGKEAA